MKRPHYYSRKAASAQSLGVTLLTVAVAFAAGAACTFYSGEKLIAVACAAFAFASFFGALVEFRIARRADSLSVAESRYQLAEGSTKRSH